MAWKSRLCLSCLVPDGCLFAFAAHWRTLGSVRIGVLCFSEIVAEDVADALGHEGVAFVVRMDRISLAARDIGIRARCGRDQLRQSLDPVRRNHSRSSRKGTIVETGSAAGTIDDRRKSSGKSYAFDDAHDPSTPAQLWFQESDEGPILFIVFYTLACRWSQCVGCNLPMKMSSRHVPFERIVDQIDRVFALPEVVSQREAIRKVIVSNNGSVLDEATFSSLALMCLLAQLKLKLPNLETLALETRPEYVDVDELTFLARALAEGKSPTRLELAVGFEAFDDRIRNDLFRKGLPLEVFEDLVAKVAPFGFRLKCYFMQKPVPGITDEEAVADVVAAIDYLDALASRHNAEINMHLNPTYAATGTPLEEAFRAGNTRRPASATSPEPRRAAEARRCRSSSACRTKDWRPRVGPSSVRATRS